MPNSFQETTTFNTKHYQALGDVFWATSYSNFGSFNQTHARPEPFMPNNRAHIHGLLVGLTVKHSHGIPALMSLASIVLSCSIVRTTFCGQQDKCQRWKVLRTPPAFRPPETIPY